MRVRDDSSKHHAVRQHWISAWQSAPSGVPTEPPEIEYLAHGPLAVMGTLRYRLRIVQGGTALRVRFSNEYRDKPLEIGAASIGLADKEFDAVAGSLIPLHFSGRPGMSVPGGAPAISDPVDLRVSAQADLLVSLFLTAPTATLALEFRDDVMLTTSAQDHTLTEQIPEATTIAARPIASAMYVRVEQPASVIAVLGNSIAEGQIDPESGNRAWPGFLSAKLADQPVSVVNAGIGGNRLLVSEAPLGNCALARLDQDVFSTPGLTHLVVSEGINDIGRSGCQSGAAHIPLVASSDLISAMRQIIARAHLHSVLVIGATLLPFAGSDYDRVDREEARRTVNQWIRESDEFDAVIDFDSIMADPTTPTRLKSEYDSGDHLHPSIEGHKAMADAFYLAFFDASERLPGESVPEI